jgi:hypothetical protein
LKGEIVAKRPKSLRLPREAELIIITKREGKQVAVSPAADKGLEEGGLCIHTDPVSGETLMCERFKNTLKVGYKIERELNKECLRVHTEIELRKALSGGDVFAVLSTTNSCTIAAVLYELSKTSSVTIGVSVCPGYIPPKEQALLYEIGVGVSEKLAPFIRKEDILKLNRDMKKLRKNEATSRKRGGK